MAEHRVQRPTSAEHAPFHAAYLARVPAGDIVGVLCAQRDTTRELLRGIPEARGDVRYAPGKWSIREVIGHLADAERILAGRAHRFARGDATPLPGFDEAAYVAAASFGSRTLGGLIDELDTVRAATLALVNGLPMEAWTRAGTSNGTLTSVRALVAIIAGHQLHHLDVLSTRYGVGSGAEVAS